eukprot:scaffold213762_cov19-Tisochrysis_lutea.AAC.3
MWMGCRSRARPGGGACCCRRRTRPPSIGPACLRAPSLPQYDHLWTCMKTVCARVSTHVCARMQSRSASRGQYGSWLQGRLQCLNATNLLVVACILRNLLHATHGAYLSTSIGKLCLATSLWVISFGCASARHASECPKDSHHNSGQSDHNSLLVRADPRCL